MLKCNSGKVLFIGIMLSCLFNCTGNKANVQEQKKSADTVAAGINKPQDQPSADTAQAAFSIPIEGYKATPLGQAVYAGDIGKVQELLKNGAPVRKCLTDETYTFDMLYAALVFDKIDLVRYIIKNKLYASVNTTYTEESETPLTLACSLKDDKDAYEIADSLIVAGADPNGAGKSGGEVTKYPLFIAVNRNSIALTTLLIGHGAKKDIQNENGETPLVIAQKKGIEGIVNILK